MANESAPQAPQASDSDEMSTEGERLLVWYCGVRTDNLQLLREAGFRVAENLPMFRRDVETPPILRPKEEILGRLLALKALWLWVDGHPKAESEATVRAMLNADGVHQHLTRDEKQILDLSRSQAVSKYGDWIGWKSENCWSLAWVLGFPDAPSVVAGQVNGDSCRRLMLDWLPNNVRESQALRVGSELRDAYEVHILEDLFYCAHNAVRSAQLGDDTVPEGYHPVVDGGCIHERRHALTWTLSPGVDWGETDLST